MPKLAVPLLEKGSSCLLHNTLEQSLNSRPKLAIFSLALADLVVYYQLDFEPEHCPHKHKYSSDLHNPQGQSAKISHVLDDKCVLCNKELTGHPR
jgi:hypothetical protein